MAIDFKKTTIDLPPLTETLSRILYHGGDSIGDPLKLATRQAADGHNYAGYYMSENPNFSANYARENGGALHRLKLADELKIKLYDGNITRVEQGILKNLIDEGYDMVQGRNPSKQMEYILLNPKKIVDDTILSKAVNGVSKLGKAAGKALPAVGYWGMIQDAMDYADKQQQSFYDMYYL